MRCSKWHLLPEGIAPAPGKFWGTLFVSKLVSKSFTSSGAQCQAVTLAAEVLSQDEQGSEQQGCALAAPTTPASLCAT